MVCTANDLRPCSLLSGRRIEFCGVRKHHSKLTILRFWGGEQTSPPTSSKNPSQLILTGIFIGPNFSGSTLIVFACLPAVLTFLSGCRTWIRSSYESAGGVTDCRDAVGGVTNAVDFRLLVQVLWELVGGTGVVSSTAIAAGPLM